MEKMTIENIGIIHDSTELRELILDNPGLPIVVLAGEEAVGSDFNYTYCSSVRCRITRILDAITPYGDECRVYNDEEEFENAVCDSLTELLPADMPNDEFNERLKEEMGKYAKSWRKVIAIYVNN